MEQKITIPDGYVLKQTSETEYKIVKIEKELPDTWEEFCKTHPIKDGEAWINSYSQVQPVGADRGSYRTDVWYSNLPNKKKADAILALCQLIQLRDCYNDGWKPDWTENSWKFCIGFRCNELKKLEYSIYNEIFAFKTKELRDKFLENFKDLLNKIKPLYQ